MIQAICVKRDAITDASVITVPEMELAAEAVRLRVQSFSVTANNVTYAAFGEAMRYWDFFPAPTGLGIVPMWGHAIVEGSNHSQINIGERVYGYLPMASHLDIVPGKIHPDSFMDMSDHRKALSPVYNQYRRLDHDAGHDSTREDARMLFEPLFKTGYLIESMFARANWNDARQLVMTSASSKTALALAAVAQEKSPHIKRIGLTSDANIGFVQKTGLYDEVLAYSDSGSIAMERSASVDFAGNGKLLFALHDHLRDHLAYSCLVGATHVTARGDGAAAAMPGPKPILFFAPDHISALIKEIGMDAFSAQVAASWQKFLACTDSLVRVDYVDGLDAAANLWPKMVQGQIAPDTGIIVRP
jgi:hypothetical protein